MTAPLPPNEVQRLQVLQSYQVLDTLPEVAFERLTNLASQYFNVPIALVSLVDKNRQWFKSCFGLDRRQTGRELSFCAYAILTDEVMVVSDAQYDPRFKDNALVTGPPHIRAYAGAPLKTPGGQNLGSFCIIDTVPREFSQDDQTMLNHLASIVIDELELRRTARELRENEAVLRKAVEENSQLAVAIANVSSGVVIADPHLPDTPLIFANAGFCGMTGYATRDVIGHNCRLLQGEGTDPTAVRDMRQALARQHAWQGILVNYRKDGTQFLNEVSINPVFDEDGNLLSYVGLQNDVTEREQAKQLLEQRVQERTAELADSQIEILQRLARAAEYRDDATGQHTQRVACTTALLAQGLGWSVEEVRMVREAAPLHDVGKIAIADRVLLKPGHLTDAEFETMKKHTIIGAAMLSEGRSEVVEMAERIARSHHEHWNGQGYPHQLAGEQIPLEGRILAVADVFDALTHERPYKKAWPLEEAVNEITRQSGKQFDPRVVEAFLALQHEELI